MTASAILLAACGGDDGGNTASTPQTPPAEPRLSKPEFIKQADAICRDFRRKAPDPASVDRPDEIAPAARRLVPLAEESVAKFEGLKPPTSDVKLIDAYAANQRRQIELLRDVADAADRGRDTRVGALLIKGLKAAARAEKIARRYGFEVCGSDVDWQPGG